MSDRNFFAKVYFKDGEPVLETLESHTENLLKEISTLKKHYQSELERLNIDSKFWKALELSCLFHDLGKISSFFQKKILKYLKEDVKIPEGLEKEIPHNYLSGCFLYNDYIYGLLNENDELFEMVLFSVLFHHNRKVDFTEEYFKEVFEKDIKPKVEHLVWIQGKYNVNICSINEEAPSFVYQNIKDFIDKNLKLKKKKEFILLKGLLHRLDHSASACLPVENEKIKNPERNLLQYLQKKPNFKGLKPFQENAKNLRDKNIILTASTGMGKTEFAVNWIGDSKAFYTLPIKVSVNAMYDRLVDIFSEEHVGLLHGDSIFYGIEESEKIDDILSFENHIVRTYATRHLSMPITVTTADQIFTSVFKYPGYEKIYGTLMYSKIVLDEPQSYSPDTLAVIIKGLQEIAYYGGKFCLMSATVHPFIKDYLKDYAEELEPVFNDESKHKIKLEEKPIEDMIDQIIENYNHGKKVLVITNTVKKSQEIFKILKEQIPNVNLLHSLFIQKDRKLKEEAIKSSTGPVVWISTQIVEASLDIDYDILFTEVATLDSLIQRMGRVYRKLGRTISQKDCPNIIVATQSQSDNGKIYNKEIVTLTLDALKCFDGRILKDESKQHLVENVYNLNNIKNTKFYEKFKKNMELLEYGFEADTKGEAQKLFREILNINVIPEKIYNENLEDIEKSIEIAVSKTTSYKEKIEALYTLNNYTLSIPFYKLKNTYPTEITPNKLKHRIFTVNFDYTEELGLYINQDKELMEIL
ncbi:CRISPR-associated helicase Cas3' [Sulfurihydrogenibium sp.]|uniref:CRISPR-associated helicase Cas3' n=1 Tax=Sulfurihydrogenibium sp. TaxID=2053621 RepID=UPI0026303E2B|nr:CRISPR-associated helicase Cas3' [Sulfurihydrogenibium sp.]